MDADEVVVPDECPHGLGDPSWCYECNGKAKRDREIAAANRARRLGKAGLVGAA